MSETKIDEFEVAQVGFSETTVSSSCFTKFAEIIGANEFEKGASEGTTTSPLQPADVVMPLRVPMQANGQVVLSKDQNAIKSED